MKNISSNVLVSSGTCTQANMRISAVTGTSFVDFSAASVLTDYLGHLLVVKDSSGRTIQGYIKAAGTGETLGGELVTNGDMETGDPPTGWTAYGGATLDGVADEHTGGAGIQSLSVTRGTNSISAYRSTSVVLGYLLKLSVWIKNTSLTSLYFGQVIDASANRIFTGTSSAGTWANVVGYGTANITTPRETDLYCTGSAGQVGQFDEVSLKQVLTPSATGVTIVSTKGGSTFNWTNKNSAFNYNDSSGYTYQIYKTQAAPVVASGSVTQANTRLDLTTDNAFAWLSGVDLSAYTDGNHMLCLYNATGGYGACGWISSTAAAGETLGGELITNGTFDVNTTGWSTEFSALSSVAGGQSNNALRLTALGTGNAIGFQNGNILTVNGLYYFSGYHKKTQTPNLWLYIGDTTVSDRYVSWGNLADASWTNKNKYFSAVLASFQVKCRLVTSTVDFYGDFDEISLKRVTDPPSAASGGVRIVSTKGGATRSWLSKSASFSANDSAGQTYKVIYAP